MNAVLPGQPLYLVQHLHGLQGKMLEPLVGKAAAPQLGQNDDPGSAGGQTGQASPHRGKIRLRLAQLDVTLHKPGMVAGDVDDIFHGVRMTRSVVFVNTRLGSRGAVSFPTLALPQAETIPSPLAGEG